MADRIARLKQFLEEDPNDPFLLFALGQEYQAAGNSTEALRMYNRLLAEFPEYIGVYYHLGKLHEAEQRHTLAAEIYTRGVEMARAQGDHHALGELRSALDAISEE